MHRARKLMRDRRLVVAALLLVGCGLWLGSTFGCQSILRVPSSYQMEVKSTFQNAFSKVTTTEEDRLLVIVIAGGSRGLVYPPFRAIWNAIADEVAKQGVFIYLVSMDPTVSSTIVNGHHLIIPGKDSLLPGVLNETLLSMDYILANKLPGSKAPFVLRTNLSSFWQFNKLLRWLEDKAAPLIAALKGEEDGVTFPSGAGTVMSMDVWRDVLSQDRAKVFTWDRIDDMTMGLLLKDRPITPMKRIDFTKSSYPQIQQALYASDDHFHYRIKGFNELYDVGVMSWLFTEWYGKDMIIRNPNKHFDASES